MRVSLVVPVYNEEQALGVFYRSVRQEASLHEQTLEIVFINDGSSDRTAEHARAIALADSGVVLINFSRNFGKEAALFAGLEYATGDAVIPMDVDLQDPVEVIPHLLAEWQKGADVVLAKRRDRSSDGYLKRRSASLFYHLLNRISYTHIEENVGDFRLMDRKVVDVIKALPEQQLFMKGVLSWAGFNVAIVEYDRAPRAVGQSKFNAWKLWNGTGWSHLVQHLAAAVVELYRRRYFAAGAGVRRVSGGGQSVVWQCGAGVSVVDDGDLVFGWGATDRDRDIGRVCGADLYGGQASAEVCGEGCVE